jgi:hypothetical protein
MFLLLLLFSLSAKAVLPPEVYEESMRRSKIKAIATIKDVETIRIGSRATSKKATFKLEYALTKRTPETFVGHCESVETDEQKANIMVGGDIYFYPFKGERVFVTVSKDGGYITSMTPMIEELEQIIREEPERIRYGISRVSMWDKERKSSKPVITPREREWRRKREEMRRAQHKVR